MTLLMIFFAKYLYIFIILASVVYIALQKRAIQKSIGLLSILSLPISFITGLIASKLFYNPRPFMVQHVKPLIAHVASNGFPSDHALLCFTLTAIIFVFNKKVGIILGIVSLLVGVGRIYARIHSPIDVLGSFIIGVGVVFILTRFIRTKISPIYK